MILYIYPKCSTCKKALQFLERKNVQFTIRDIILETPTKEEMKSYIDRSGKDIKKFFNTSGMKYRELGLKDRLDSMELDERIELLVSDGMLIKRPMLVMDDKVINGFRESEWLEIIEKNK